ncbi:MAG: ParB/RepB/Spo0J family partition protein [Clostridia bacterium]|nr:ParB/RepB/Spo0J family partition protein [Clostridia bacterium]
MERKIEEIKRGEQIWSIPTSKIFPNPNQPRKSFSEDSIIKLADSIRQFGIIQPLSVRRNGEDYELIAGERRLRAAKELNLDFVPCVILEATEEKSAEISIIENLIREDLNIFEQAMAIQVLIDTYGLTQERVAEKLSNSQPFVANKLRLLRFSSIEREIILKNKLTERHARALLRIPDEDLRLSVLNKIAIEGINVAKSEELIEKLLDKSAPKQKQPTYKDITSFYTAINRVIDTMSHSGFKIKSRKIENDNFTELTILIPKETQSNPSNIPNPSNLSNPSTPSSLLNISGSSNPPSSLTPSRSSSLPDLHNPQNLQKSPNLSGPSSPSNPPHSSNQPSPQISSGIPNPSPQPGPINSSQDDLPVVFHLSSH